VMTNSVMQRNQIGTPGPSCPKADDHPLGIQCQGHAKNNTSMHKKPARKGSQRCHHNLVIRHIPHQVVHHEA